MTIKDYIKKADCAKCKYGEVSNRSKIMCSVFEDLENSAVQCSAFEEKEDVSISQKYKVKVDLTLPDNLEMTIEAHSKEEAENIAVSIFKQSISVKAEATNE